MPEVVRRDALFQFPSEWAFKIFFHSCGVFMVGHVESSVISSELEFGGVLYLYIAIGIDLD